jgi:hypothetical protein
MDEKPSLLIRFKESTFAHFLWWLFPYAVAYLLANLLPNVFGRFRPELNDLLLAPINNFLQQQVGPLIFAISLGVWLVFFAQFVLPVRTFRSRLRIVDRLITYWLGRHGPAMFVENGIVRARKDEKMRSGPGVIWLDSASAAILRTSIKFTDTIGPGIHFTESNEHIAGTADLHPLTQTVGPANDDRDERDPFVCEKAKNSDNEKEKEKVPQDYDAIQKRRWETSALTRDGIEVVATISVNFHIASAPGEGNTRFGFNQENARRAIRDSLTRGANVDQPVWSQLPAKMAVDVWREYVHRFRQDELFDLGEEQPETGLQIIGKMVKKRLTQREVEHLDNFGDVVIRPEAACREVFERHTLANLYADIRVRLEEFTHSESFSYRGMYPLLVENNKSREAEDYLEKVNSREFAMLSEMGWEVTGVTIKRLIFAPAIEERLITLWTALWRQKAEEERNQVDRARKLAETAGQEEALKEYATDATRSFQHAPLPNKFDALFDLVHNLFLGMRRNTPLLRRTTTEQRELSDIFSWLRDRGERG